MKKQKSVLQLKYKKMKVPYAFLTKNFKSLSKEEQTIAVANMITVLCCFFPWVSIEPYDYMKSPYWLSAFGGSTILIGILIFLMSGTIVAYFLDRLWDRKKIKLPIPPLYFFLGVSGETILFLILTASVWMIGGDDIGSVELRFGIFTAFLAQIAGGLASFFEYQNTQKNKVQSFFAIPKQESLQNNSSKKHSFQPMEIDTSMPVQKILEPISEKELPPHTFENTIERQTSFFDPSHDNNPTQQ